MTEILTLKNVSKLIGTKQIIDNASFSVEQGQVVGLLGPKETYIVRQ